MPRGAVLFGSDCLWWKHGREPGVSSLNPCTPVKLGVKAISGNEMFKLKKTCVDCHYFHRQYRNETGSEHKFEITSKQRANVKNNDYSWQRDNESLGCYKGVWDEGHNFPSQDRHIIIAKTNRRNKCYFWEYQPGSFFPVAEKLQEKHMQSKIVTRSYRLTIYGLLLTILGLLFVIIK